MMREVKLADLTLEQKQLLASPYGFSKHYLGLPVMDTPRTKVAECRDGSEVYYEVFNDDWQKNLLDATAPHGAKVTARTCNGAGKTTVLLPGAVFWFMTYHPRGKVVITSGVERQVRSQIFPALKAQAPKLKGWHFTDNSIAAPNGASAIGFSTNDGGRFEGWHGNKDPFYDLIQHDGPLMLIFDEAKSVAQAIFDARERCTFQHLLEVSSCGGTTGEFYKHHAVQARFYQTFQIPASLCPHADHDKNRELIQKRGLNDPLVRSKVFAEFMGDTAGAVIQRRWVEAAAMRPPVFSPGSRRIFCDFAGGGDENVIAERRGNRVRVVAACRERDTMRACGWFIDHFRQLGLTPSTITEIAAGDAGGLGKPMLDRLDEVGWVLQRVHNGGKANDSHYKNRSTETWYEGGKKFEKGRIILENADEVTIAQLTERQGWANSNGTLEIMSKEDMRKEGLESPDRADAILEAMREDNVLEPHKVLGNPDQNMGLLERMLEERGDNVLAGMHTG